MAGEHEVVFKCACMHSGVNKMVGFDERVNLGMIWIFWWGLNWPLLEFQNFKKWPGG